MSSAEIRCCDNER